jgi:catalase
MQEFDEMSDDQSGETTSKRPLTTAGVVIRLGAIGVAVLCVAGAFAYTGGWLSPRRLTEDRMLAAFTDAEGLHPGFRRNHAKGVCVSGWFDSNGQAVSFSTATVFKPVRTAIVGRFGLSGANPFQADQPAIVRSMAVKFLLPGAGEWRITMNNEAVFGVNSAQGFRDQVLASIPDPATGKPDPAKVKAFMAAHPETVRAMAVIKQSPPSQGFADSTFNSLNAFRLVNAAGVHSGSLGHSAHAAVRGRVCGAVGIERRELSLRRPNPADSPASVAMAPDDYHWPTWRPHRRRDVALACRSAANQRRHCDN